MTYDENDDYNGPDIHRRGPFLFMAAIVGVILVAGGVAAVSDARADEVPAFTVSQEGVNLAPGRSFVDGDHVNIRATAPHNDLHFEAKCIDRVDAECAALHDAAQYIGKSFIPWSAFGLTDGCVSWVQVAGINKHFGDAGEAPICLGGTPSAPSTPTAPKPQPTGTPTTIPNPAPTTTTPATQEPSPSPIQTSSPILTPDAPTAITDGGSLFSSADHSETGAARLADTGRPVTVWDLGLVMFATLVIGLGALVLVRRTEP